MSLILSTIEPTNYVKICINLRIASRGSSSPEYLEILFCDLFSFFFPHSIKEKNLVAELPAHPEDSVWKFVTH